MGGLGARNRIGALDPNCMEFSLPLLPSRIEKNGVSSERQGYYKTLRKFLPNISANVPSQHLANNSMNSLKFEIGFDPSFHVSLDAVNFENSLSNEAASVSFFEYCSPL
mmetsp:Transcript_27892/g.67799  ORF Transcript_27892/g.67799 Transcript_27892/m.67799 type:complete len:109 (-) Transcript_27892:140-466(-)